MNSIPDFFTDLPREIVYGIFSKNSAKELLNVRLASKKLYNVAIQYLLGSKRLKSSTIQKMSASWAFEISCFRDVTVHSLVLSSIKDSPFSTLDRIHALFSIAKQYNPNSPFTSQPLSTSSSSDQTKCLTHSIYFLAQLYTEGKQKTLFQSLKSTNKIVDSAYHKDSKLQLLVNPILINLPNEYFKKELERLTSLRTLVEFDVNILANFSDSLNSFQIMQILTNLRSERYNVRYDTTDKITFPPIHKIISALLFAKKPLKRNVEIILSSFFESFSIKNEYVSHKDYYDYDNYDANNNTDWTNKVLEKFQSDFETPETNVPYWNWAAGKIIEEFENENCKVSIYHANVGVWEGLEILLALSSEMNSTNISRIVKLFSDVIFNKNSPKGYCPLPFQLLERLAPKMSVSDIHFLLQEVVKNLQNREYWHTMHTNTINIISKLVKLFEGNESLNEEYLKFFKFLIPPFIRYIRNSSKDRRFESNDLLLMQTISPRLTASDLSDILLHINTEWPQIDVFKDEAFLEVLSCFDSSVIQVALRSEIDRFKQTFDESSVDKKWVSRLPQLCFLIKKFEKNDVDWFMQTFIEPKFLELTKFAKDNPIFKKNIKMISYCFHLLTLKHIAEIIPLLVNRLDFYGYFILFLENIKHRLSDEQIDYILKNLAMNYDEFQKLLEKCNSTYTPALYVWIKLAPVIKRSHLKTHFQKFLPLLFKEETRNYKNLPDLMSDLAPLLNSQMIKQFFEQMKLMDVKQEYLKHMMNMLSQFIVKGKCKFEDFKTIKNFEKSPIELSILEQVQVLFQAATKES